MNQTNSSGTVSLHQARRFSELIRSRLLPLAACHGYAEFRFREIFEGFYQPAIPHLYPVRI